MAAGRDLEKDLLLAFEQDFAVVHTAGRVHRPIRINELLAGQARIGFGLLVFGGGRIQLGVGFGELTIQYPMGWGDMLGAL